MIEYENLKLANKPFFLEYKKAFDSTLESGWFILGEKVGEFEKDFANYTGCGYCSGVASGLDALTLSLKALNFRMGEEVIVPSNTYIATILSIIHNGLKPVLVEPDIRTYNIDPGKIEEKITGNTRGIMVVHLYGKPCSMDPVMKIAARYGLKVIEDCAQSHGAKYKGKQTGSFGDFGAFSFYPTKNLGALGDGGAITTSSLDLDHAVKVLRNYGQEKKYHNIVPGYNSRLDELQAAFLLVKLRSLDDIISHKRSLAELYHTYLKNDFIKPIVEDDYHDVYHIFTVRHERRDSLREHLLKNGIRTEIHYPVPPHKQKALQGHVDNGSYPISEKIHSTILSLPISYFHQKDDILKVIEAMNKF